MKPQFTHNWVVVCIKYLALSPLLKSIISKRLGGIPFAPTSISNITYQYLELQPASLVPAPVGIVGDMVTRGGVISSIHSVRTVQLSVLFQKKHHFLKNTGQNFCKESNVNVRVPIE